MSLFNPFCKCLNPQRIVNPYTNEAMTVPCGHCNYVVVQPLL
nr:MAG TPA: YABBY protein [Microviridae sp.]